MRTILLSIGLLLSSLPLAGGGGVPGGDVPLRDDGRFDVVPYKGSVVYLDFWASWCEPCKKSMPWLVEMDEKYREAGLVIVAVNVDRDRADATSFLEDINPPFRLVFDPNGEIARAHALEGMPSAFIFDRDGATAATLVGFRDQDRKNIEEQLRKLLGDSGDGASK